MPGRSATAANVVADQWAQGRGMVPHGRRQVMAAVIAVVMVVLAVGMAWWRG